MSSDTEAADRIALGEALPYPPSPPTQADLTDDNIATNSPTALTTPPTSSQRQFHPAHNDLEDDVILESSEGVCFRVPRPALVQKSDFFDHILQLPAPQDTEDQQSIPLISTGTQALLVTVEWVKRTPTFTPPLSLPDPISEASQFVNDIIQVADAYDMPGLNQAMLDQLVADRSFPPLTFLFAVLTGAEKERLNSYTFTLLPYSGEFASGAWWGHTLKHKAPQIYRQLGDVFQKWDELSSSFDSASHSQSSRFGQKCRSTWCPDTQTYIHYSSYTPLAALCPVFQSFDGNFALFRQQIDPPLHTLLSNAWRRGGMTGPYHYVKLFEELQVRSLECTICTNRLARDLQVAVESVRRMWQQLIWQYPLWPLQLA